MEFLDYLLHLSNTTRSSVDFETINYINWDELPKKYKERKNYKRWEDLEYVQVAFKSLVDGNTNRYNSSNQMINPNLLAYFIDNEACEIKIEDETVVEKKKKEKKVKVYYLVDKSDENIRIRINKQIVFSYQFFVSVKNYCKKMNEEGKKIYIDKLLNDNGNIKVKPTKIETDNKGVYNYFIIKLTDIPIGLGVEFIEESPNEKENDLKKDKIQENDNIRRFMNPKLKHITYVWEGIWNRDDGYREYYIEELDKLFSLYYP